MRIDTLGAAGAGHRVLRSVFGRVDDWVGGFESDQIVVGLGSVSVREGVWMLVFRKVIC